MTPCTLCGGRVASDGACDDCGSAVISVGRRAFPAQETETVHVGPVLAKMEPGGGPVVLTPTGRVLQARLDACRPASGVDLAELFLSGSADDIEAAILLAFSAAGALTREEVTGLSDADRTELGALYALERVRASTPRARERLRPGMLEIHRKEPPALELLDPAGAAANMLDAVRRLPDDLEPGTADDRGAL